MKKDDRYLQFNKKYWAENREMLKQPTYQQYIRQDRLTGRDMVAAELKQIKEKEYENEQAKIRSRQEAEEQEAAQERAEFEEWKRQKAEKVNEARTHNARTHKEGDLP
jgi:septal ring factor EnvC (AmiA/AmiB activator)